VAAILKERQRTLPKVGLPQMLQEHKPIVAGLTKLLDAARKENKPAQVHFVEQLQLHAQTEEELLTFAVDQLTYEPPF
jgi:hypothetical protein